MEIRGSGQPPLSTLHGVEKLLPLTLQMTPVEIIRFSDSSGRVSLIVTPKVWHDGREGSLVAKPAASTKTDEAKSSVEDVRKFDNMVGDDLRIECGRKTSERIVLMKRDLRIIDYIPGGMLGFLIDTSAWHSTPKLGPRKIRHRGVMSLQDRFAYYSRLGS